jgi:purine-binding chemotaxis protein CheW
VAQCGDKLAGLLVDSVQETFHVSAAQLQAPPAVCGGRVSVIDAILPLEGRMISRLIIDRLVPHDSLVAA